MNHLDIGRAFDFIDTCLRNLNENDKDYEEFENLKEIMLEFKNDYLERGNLYKVETNKDKAQ